MESTESGPIIDEVGRPEPPLHGDDRTMLVAFLEFQRATLEWKCRDISADGLRATVGASTMTLGGLLKHLAWVEDYWFSWRLHGTAPGAPWAAVDWRADPDWEWHSAAADTSEDLFALWHAAVARSQSVVADVLSTGGLDTAARSRRSDDRAPSLRWILLHMIEEYARHNGHADLLRESVDGSVGE